MATPALKVLDISHHQPPSKINWDKLAADDDLAGVIIKASGGDNLDGKGYVDPHFAEHWAAAIATGKPVGAYHFCLPRTKGGGADDGRAEARHFCATVLAAGVPRLMIYPAADFEWSGTSPDHSAQQNLDFLGAFEGVVASLLGVTPMLYTGRPTWKHRCGWSTELAHWRLWWARYTKRPGSTPWPLTLWQYTGSGEIDGVRGKVDLSRFEGTHDDFAEQLCGLGPQLPCPAPSPVDPPHAYLDLANPAPGTADDIEDVQWQLNVRLGQHLTVDGVSGPKTQESYARVSGGPLVVDWLDLYSV